MEYRYELHTSAGDGPFNQDCAKEIYDTYLEAFQAGVAFIYAEIVKRGVVCDVVTFRHGLIDMPLGNAIIAQPCEEGFKSRTFASCWIETECKGTTDCQCHGCQEEAANRDVIRWEM